MPYDAPAQDYTTGLAAHWNFDDGSLGNANDNGANGYDGTLTNMDLGAVWNSPGKLGTHHLTFDGVDDYISIGSASNLNFSNNFSVTAWVKKASDNATGPIFNRGNPGSDGYAFGIGEAPCAATQIKASKFGIADLCGGTVPADENWHHYAAVWRAGGVSFYVDGQPSGSVVNVSALNLSGGNAYIGSNEDLIDFFSGTIDDVRVYNRILTAADVMALYNAAGGPGTCDSERAGVLIYNHDKKVMQYCNGTSWIAAGAHASCGQSSCGGSGAERLVFVAPTANGNLGGVSGADATCQAAADAAGFKGTYLAWIADSNNSSAPSTRFEKPSVPYIMPDGTKVAQSWADLIDGTILSAIDVQSDGSTAPTYIWTNVTSAGNRKGTNNCSNWTSSVAASTHGIFSFVDYRWTDFGTNTCSFSSGVYCFEQGPPTDGTCTSPDGVEGEIDFNVKHATLQYCNGSGWINMGPKIAGISPADNIPTTGLIAHWKLDDGVTDINSTTAADSSGNGHAATLTNMTPASDWLPAGGIDGGALDFDGTNDYLATASNAAFSIKDLTLSAWIYIPNSIPASYRAIVWQSASGDNNYSLWISQNTNKLHFRWSNGWIGPVAESNMYMDSNMSIAPDTWYHVVGTYDDPTNTAKLYINGALDRVKTGANDPVLRSNPIQIAGIPGSNFPGRIDDVRVYGRDLGADEVEALYLGTGGTLNPDPCAGNPAIGAVCADGSVYAGISPDGSTPMYTTPCDMGMTWNGTTCTGTRITDTWNDGNSANKVTTNTISTTDGDGNTATLISLDSDSGTPGAQPHRDAKRCADLEAHGKTDWYLPAINEVQELYNNRVAIGNFEYTVGGGGTVSRYQSSTEFNNAQAYHFFMFGGAITNGVKEADFAYIRCVRKGSPSGVSLGSCSNPDGVAGEIVYNASHTLMQYCNGANWIEMK